MRVATWNVWHRFGDDYEVRSEAIATALAPVDADVLCLQEVWTEPEGERSQAAELAAHLGLEAHADAHRVVSEGFTFGNAIVSRWPITRQETRPLPPHPDYEEFRTVLAVEIAHPDGPVQVFTTHLNFLGHQSGVRQAQVRAVARMMHEWRRDDLVRPQVLTGDLNAEPISDEVRMLTGHADLGVPLALLDAWRVRGRGDGATWSSRNPLTHASFEPDRRIDYVLVGFPISYGGRGQVESVEIFGDDPVDGTWPSDHFGVVADLSD
ncbi:endonuclease/exonuclease/phosphatase family protein [Euzebya sp.]|uniref:endonuclease/exonuclease/phosphatase family protein n=1 Tax=Euzebya sp. TaxID=1971409 RepID=UPI0035160DA9